MPIRMALNFVYAVLMQDRDGDQRQELDEVLYGWAEQNQRGNRSLQAMMMGGGED